MGNRTFLLAVVFVSALALASVVAFMGEADERYPQQAEFAVQNLTCAVCVDNVQRALSTVDGVGRSNVNVLSGTTRVEFDPARVDAERIAAVITSAGYPAFPRESISPEALLALQSEAQRLAADYVGRIGGRLVAKADFELEVDLLKSSMPPQHGRMPAESLKMLVWQNVVQRETLLAEVERRNMSVQDDEVAAEVEAMRAEIPDFDSLVGQFGGEEQVARRLKEDLLINRLIEDQINGSGLPHDQARIQLAQWYQGLADATMVEVFDPELRSAQMGCNCCS